MMRLYEYSDVVAYKTAAALASVASAVGAREADWSTVWFGVPLPVLLMAFAGAALALSLLPPMKKSQMVASVLLGAAFGVFMPQLIVTWQPGLQPALTAAAFFCGLCGKLGASMIFEDGRTLVIGWIKSKIGGGGAA